MCMHACSVNCYKDLNSIIRTGKTYGWIPVAIYRFSTIEMFDITPTHGYFLTINKGKYVFE